MKTVTRSPALPAPDLFAWRRALAGIPDFVRLERLPVVGGRLELVQVVDVPRPRPIRPALDGEAP